MAQLALAFFGVWGYSNNIPDERKNSMTASFSYPTQAELLTVMAKTEFKPFDKADWDAFAGCETAEPMIGYYGEFTIVIDGDMINIVHGEDMYGGQLFGLNKLA
jgi:hypothetical protein